MIIYIKEVTVGKNQKTEIWFIIGVNFTLLCAITTITMFINPYFSTEAIALSFVVTLISGFITSLYFPKTRGQNG